MLKIFFSFCLILLLLLFNFILEQRNVGILEKISQQLLATPANASNRSELEQQYKVQLDVLRQLEQRLRQQILSQRKQVGTSESKKQALIKLERDFQRVQGIAQSYKARVTRQQKQYQQRGTDPTGMGGMSADNRAANTLQQEQERFQIQLQEDVSFFFFIFHLFCRRTLPIFMLFALFSIRWI